MRTATIILFVLTLGLAADAGPLAGLDGVLESFVDDAGLVDYAGLKSDRARLDAVVKSIADQDPSAYESWRESDRLAFWINAYNALTLRLLVDHYPVQPAPGRQAYPASSIQQIPNAWTGVRFTVMGKERTLDDIEHKVIRAGFREPRVHWALVCGAMSCPPLRREAYRGADLDAQLNDQAARFFAGARNLQVDHAHNEVWVSRIIQWFADDFLAGASGSPGRTSARAAVVAAAAPHVDAAAKRYLETASYQVRYTEYDWALNEQTK